MLQRFGQEASWFLQPLEEAVDEPAHLLRLLRYLGAELPEIPTTITGLGRDLAGARAALTALAEADELDAPALAGAVTAVWEAAEAVQQLLQTDLTALELAPGSVVAAIGRLPHYLGVRWLDRRAPEVLLALRATGVIEREEGVPFEVFRRDRLEALVEDPVAALIDLYGWGEGLAWDHARLLWVLDMCAMAFGWAGRWGAIPPAWTEGGAPLLSPTRTDLEELATLRLPLVAWRTSVGRIADQAGLLLGPMAAAPDGMLDGLFLSPWSTFTATDLEVGGFAFDVPVALDAPAVGVLARPTGVTLLGSLPDAPRIGVRRVAPLDLGPEVQLLDLRASLGLPVGGGELSLDAGVTLQISVDPAQTDSFLRSLLPGAGLQATVALDVGWSSTSGLSIDAGAALSLTIPLELTLGPLYLDRAVLNVAVGAAGGTAALDASFTLSALATLGPFVFVLDGIGIAVRASDDPAGSALVRFGRLGVDIGLALPDSLGVSLDLVVASGGGYLDVDREQGRYAGILDLDLKGVGITAVGILTTRIPSDPDAWSLFASLTASFGAGIPLGFGFSLTGVGGLVGVNRGLDVEALGDGIRQGSLDAILFPSDPVARAPQILAELDTFFPPQVGQYVFGPMLAIRWGAASIFEVELGVIVQLPEPLTVTLLGSFSALLPTEETPILQLRVDLAGTLDLTAGTLAIDASLVDSRVLALELTGDMAVRASFFTAPTFLVAFGGFHPDFVPPASFPSLRRLGVALDTGDELRIALGGYFAITSNTLQFGAEYSLWASALGFTAEGGASFDALLQFDPFGFAIDLEVWVTVTGAGLDLGVQFVGALSGPNPWQASGAATFEVLGIRASIEVSATFGDRASEPAPHTVDVLALVLEDLRRESSWIAVPPHTSGVVTTAAGDGPLAVHPAGRVEVRQRVVPLDTTIERFGEARIGGGIDTFALTGARIGAVAVGAGDDPVEDYFAAAQFFDLREMERLSSPSFELMRAGTRLGDGTLAQGPARTYTYDHEVVYRDPLARRDDRERPGAVSPAPATASVRSVAAVGSVAPGLGRRALTTTSSFALKAPTWVAVDPSSGAPVGSAPRATYAKARAAAASAVVIPAYELVQRGSGG